ncbi:MAG: shikimate kinase [Clostridia bacterium]|nr:shikimate kinase [Clostridia bacterium]
MKNIVLIGMPGCGKSSLGVILAKQLGMQFCDTDLLIQQSEHRKLQEIQNQDGVEKFLEIEEREILKLNCTNTVIATGGSVILKSHAVEHLKKIGTLIYIKLSYEAIEKRIHNLATRGIAMNGNQTLYDVYKQRTVLYENNADIILESDGLSVTESLEQLEQIIQDIN